MTYTTTVSRDARFNDPISQRHAAMAEEVRSLKGAVDAMLQLYDDDDGDNFMNETQPPSFARVIPMSLDAWSLELSACADDWDASALAFHNAYEFHKRGLGVTASPRPALLQQLDALGFIYEFPGQYELHAPDGSRVGVSGSDGSGAPTESDWAVCYYPPDQGGAPLAFDMRSNDWRGPVALQRTLRAALVLAGVEQ